jgi:hypothetical protein
VLSADRRGYRLARSRGWPGEAAALDAVRLLDTRAASAEVRELAGFFALGPDSWVVVRGGCDAAPREDCRRHWREAIAIERAEFARLRFNPFRLLPGRPVGVDDSPDIGLTPPELPRDATLADDMRRLAELRRPDGAAVSPHALETLLAAVLETEQTLMLGSDLSYDDLELLLLLLPAPLRPYVTFHSHAAGLPSPVPRLVLTPDTNDEAFENAGFTLGHCLPATADRIARRSRRVARELIELAAVPERLAAAHHGFEQYVARLRPARRPLQAEVETLLRFARLRQARESGHVSEALRLLSDSVIAHGKTAHQEPRWMVELIRLGFPPDAVGLAVADSLRVGDAGLVPAFVIERYALRRRKDAGEFAAFARRIEQLASELAVSASGDTARRVRTMLLLLAAARGDAAGMVAALDVPVDRELVRRLGGVDAWAPTASEPVAHALRALVDANAPDTIGAAIAALHAFMPEVPHGLERIRLAECAVEFVRHAFRQLPATSWRDGAGLARAALELCVAVTAGSRISLDGRPDTEHYRELLSRSMNPRALLELQGHGDAELFFGLLGSDASRSRVSRREVAERGHLLVRAVHERIERDAAGTRTAEGVHWSVALLERVRAGELEKEHLPLALDLLRLSAGDDANRILRAYFEAFPAMALMLLEHSRPREYLDMLEFAALAAAALDAALARSIEERDLSGVATLCLRLRQAGVLLTAADLRPGVEPRLHALIAELRAKATRPLAVYLKPLYRVLAPILTPDAEQLVRTLLLEQPEPVQKVAPVARFAAFADAASTAAADPVRARRLASAAMAFLGIAFVGMAAVLLATERGRRALFGEGELTAANVGAAATPRPQAAPPIEIPPDERLARARGFASTGAWTDVVALLLGDTLDASAPGANTVAWDSLLALGALRMGERIPPGDIRRELLLNLTFTYAGRALRGPLDGPASADFLRLLRAEACITGPLECGDAVVNAELTRASRSADPVVRARAAQFLEARRSRGS